MMCPEETKPQEGTKKAHSNVYKEICSSICPQIGCDRGIVRKVMKFHLKSEFIGDSDAAKVNQARLSDIDVLMMTLDTSNCGLLRKSNLKECFKSLVDQQDPDSKAELETMLDKVFGALFSKKVQ